MRGEHDSVQCPRGRITCLPLGALDSSGFRPHGLGMLCLRERMIYRVISPPSAGCCSCTFQPGQTENRSQCWNGREIQKVTEVGLGCSEHHPVTGIGLNDPKDFAWGLVPGSAQQCGQGVCLGAGVASLGAAKKRRGAPAGLELAAQPGASFSEPWCVICKGLGGIRKRGLLTPRWAESFQRLLGSPGGRP